MFRSSLDTLVIIGKKIQEESLFLFVAFDNMQMRITLSIKLVPTLYHSNVEFCTDLSEVEEFSITAALAIDHIYTVTIFSFTSCLGWGVQIKG